jgi:glycosyltransferase involved in cell wall biosynthesis
MIRVCILIGRYLPDFSGHAIQTHRFLPHLRPLGIDATVVAYRPSAETAGTQVADNGRVLRVLAPERAPLAKTRHTLELAAHFRRHARDYDLVHTILHGWELLLNVPWMQRLGLPVLYEMVLLGTDDPVTVSRLRFGAAKLALLRRMDSWVGISEAFRPTLQATGISDRWFRRIYCAVDVERYRPLSEAERCATRAALGLPADARIAVSAGALVPRKGMDRVLRAWAALRPKPGRDLLLLAGPASLEQGLPPRFAGHPAELRALAAAAGVADTVRFLGRVEDLERWYGAADLCLFLSHREGQGTVIVEAMACGLPCVVSPLDGIGRELVAESGFVIDDPDDPQAVAARASELLADRERSRRLGERARAVAVERFSMTARAEAFAAAYRELLDASAGRRRSSPSSRRR